MKSYLRPFVKRLAKAEAVGQSHDPKDITITTGDSLEGHIYEVFFKLQQHYALQEHWQGLPKYIWRVVSSVQRQNEPKLVTGLDPETAQGMTRRQQQGKGHTRAREESPGYPFVVPKAAPWLTAQGWPVSPRTLYRWLEQGKIPVVADTRGRKCIDEAGLQRAMVLVRTNYRRKAQRNAIMDRLTEEEGKTSEAAKRTISRHLAREEARGKARGQALADMAKALLHQQAQDQQGDACNSW